MKVLSFLAALLFTLSASASPQTASSPSPPPQRDTQAISILQKSLAALGSDRLPQIADLTISGQIVQQRALDKATGTILLKMIGPEMVRVETTDLDGTTIHIVNGTRVRRIHGTDDQPMPMHAALNHPWQYVPLLSCPVAVTDPELSVSLLAEEMIDGKSVYHVHTEKVYAQQSAETAKILAKLTGTDFYIDKGTFLLVVRTQQLPTLLDAQNSFPMEFRYSDYRQVQGVMIPYNVSVYVNNQKSAEIYFTSLVLNGGVNHREFEVQP